ncbi:nitroreductase family deazaflavin-dependent oxidoreductase [Gordonia zhaorongruii]|uniref:nitroreductase family deazaflavin-dependent oxidoreductase n=1 Tax=Gordonia zhaorongruii TaxID=2597659 RepID=UPI001051D877|nr:nitroreductase family deazaflavin-dependent oxidoreductase [Gordonia zhaorongruii]
MGILTRLAIWIGSFAWLPPHLPKIVKVDALLQRCSGGRIDMLTIAGLPGVTMTVVGRRSGAARTTTVLAAPDGDDWIVAGSHFGGPKSPAWVFNVRDAETVDVRGVKGPMVPVELDGDARAIAWQRLLDVWPNFRLYEERTDRVIPVFRLSPAL